jgi:hypothetical protein
MVGIRMLPPRQGGVPLPRTSSLDRPLDILVDIEGDQEW